MPVIQITDYQVGALGRLIELHGLYYSKHWNFDSFFETFVAVDLAQFIKRFDPETDLLKIALVDGIVAGGIVIDGSEHQSGGARLRFFILDEAYQGQGIGKQLMQAAMDFCREKGFRRCYLTTFAGLDAARHLYEKWGFRLQEEQEDTTWGKPALKQVFVYDESFSATIAE